MSFAAFIVPVAALVLVPLAWSGAVAGVRALTTPTPALERGELSVLSIMLAPVLIGGLCLAWAAAPLPYVAPPLLAEALVLPLEHVIAPPEGEAIATAAAFDWFGGGALLLCAAYALGFAWHAVRLGWAQMRVARIAARASDASDVWGADVALTDAPVSAFLAMNGKIILPRVLTQALTSAQVQLIIAHERSHRARSDAMLFAALAWIDAACWFNPFVRAQTARCRLAAELACDAAASSAAPDMRRAYAETLIAALKLGASHPAGSALQCAPAVFSTGITGDHRMRIERIMSAAPSPRKRAMWGVYAAACLLAAPVAVLQAAIAQPVVGQGVRESVASVAPLVVAQQSAASVDARLTVIPNAGRITSRFGDHRDASTGLPPTHMGVDFAGPEGMEIVAAGAGRVVRVQEWERYGKLIDIDHGGGLMTRYSHLSAFDVREGDTVSAGQLVGRMGATGLPNMPVHLHFEVWQGGTRIDPASVLSVLN